MKPHFIGVAGLPRAGSTLLCQLLAQHPEIHCEGRSSPLCNTLLGIRRMISNDSFFLSQLDNSFDTSYAHLTAGMQGFLHGWNQNCEKPVVIDKNRGWLSAIEMLLHIEPDAKLILCVRELGQIYGSIEAQHQRTILVDFPDRLADYDRIERANLLFSKDKTIGFALNSLRSIQELSPAIQQRLYFARFEDVIAQPVTCMSHLYAWLGVSPFKINPEKLTVGIQESDSHYRMKYSHKQKTQIIQPKLHEIPPRIQSRIEEDSAWFYQRYYPPKK